MASSSTHLHNGDGASLPSVSTSWKYDVFLSFRGEDTRNGFVDHLYSALHQKLIFTFRDDLKLERGEWIYPALLKAIEESRFAVVVFSKDYASSKWCLEELVKILECQRTRALNVLPVFYKVDPSDLRHQRGSVAEAFAKHERDSRNVEKEKQKVQRWRDALMEAANISGWDSKTHGPEAELVRNIAIHILNRLGYNDSSILKDVVGLYPRVTEVMSRLEMKLDLDDPRIVGIWGMGGIGKTTIVSAIYHQIRSQFHVSCYLENIREVAEKHGLQSLQKSLLCELLSVSDSDIKINNLQQGLGMMMNRVRCGRVLVVLDDVDKATQLEALFGELDWFGPGSRIIITTRDCRLLEILEVKHVYNVKELNHKEALDLFCRKAFRKNQTIQGYEGLTNSVVSYARGVPLALKVLGTFLYNRSEIEWQSAIDRLRQQPDKTIQEVLKLSYNGLCYLEQRIFLDIACFFKWKRQDYVIDILNACGFNADIGMRVLEEKGLVTIRGNMIDMHDLIQEMGRHIVNEDFPNEPGKRSRLWKYEDIYDMLTNNTGTEAVEAIVLDSHETKEMPLCPNTFSKMTKLRLLKLSNVQLSDGLDYLSSDLRFLNWHKYPLKYLPSNFLPNNLVELKMSSSYLERLWNGRMCLDKLKYIDLSYSQCITKSLDFPRAANLEKLILEGCMKLVEIDPSIKAIERLVFLNLRGCKCLKVLPEGRWLKSVERLDLSGCLKLKNVSEVLPFMECLISLNLDGIYVKELPVEHLSNLKYISLRDCKEFTSLPSGICGLKSLRILSVSGCSKLSELPENLGGLQRLSHFYADFTAIKQPPSSIVHLKELKLLSFSGCKGGATSTPWNSLFSSFFIPKGHQDPMGFKLPSLFGLHSLTLLDLTNCSLSKGFLPDDVGCLSNLVTLRLSGTNIISLPASISYLSCLWHLYLEDCKKLKMLGRLPTRIRVIDARGCTSLETMQDLHLCGEYHFVKLINCHTLAKNQPGLHIEFIRNNLKNFAHFREWTLSFPGREIPNWFSYQNNMGHYVQVQLTPDWYQSVKGFVVCAIFEAKAPIDATILLECYGIRIDDVVCYADQVKIKGSHFGSDHFFLRYQEFSKRSKWETWTEILFYCTSSHPEMFTPVKCAVELIHEKDEGEPNSKKFRRDIGAQWRRDSDPDEPSEIRIRNMRNSIDWDAGSAWINEGSDRAWREYF